MSNFKRFSQAVHYTFTAMANTGQLYVTVNGDEVWDRYLAAFPEGTNPIYRERTEHDCSCCRNFIRNLGNVVTIRDGALVSVWSCHEDLEYPYNEVAKALDDFVTSAFISDIYATKEPKYGAERNFETLANGDVKEWNHFHGSLPRKFIYSSPGQVRGAFKTNVGVFLRGLEELTQDALAQIADLIDSNSLYRGEEHKAKLVEFSKLKFIFDQMENPAHRDMFVWQYVNQPAALFRNTVIGTLAVDLSADRPLEEAVASFEKKVAPENYQRPKALITQRMVKEAMKTINELGLEPSLERRHANLSDVNINDVLWADNSARQRMQGIENLLMDAAAKQQRIHEDGEAISVDDFVTDVLPMAKTMDIFMRGSMQNNLMSITAPVHNDAALLFKWPNQFAWSYNGNVTDSIKEKVKKAGGNVSAPFRVSLAWFNGDDLDLHCFSPSGERIYFGNRCGILDVDMNAGGPQNSKDPVENMAWQRGVPNGTYKFVVDQYRQRSRDNVGFVIQIENNGQIWEYSYNRVVHDQIIAATIEMRDGLIVNMEIADALGGGGVVQEKWGIHTEQFVPVDTIMLSPNHWGDSAVGNKHWLFALRGCNNPEPVRGIYNEYLRADLKDHRKVFEVLGSKTMCPPAEKQLSGLGFSSTRGDTVTVRVYDGSRTRTFEVAF